MSPRDWIRERALALGFDAAGFARAPAPDEPFAEGLLFRDWLARGHAAGMGWLARTAERRARPHEVLAGLRTVVVLLWAYPGAAPEPAPGEGRVARYARGRDYHNVLGRRVRKLLRAVLERWPEADGYSFVDRGAVLEKAWAVRAGLGWMGKNTLVLSRERGSYTLLAALFLDLELPADEPQPDQCGSCRLCLDSCPTASFPAPGVLDAGRCVSYLTIEHRGSIPVGLRAALADRLFGCDACQEVCPFNRFPAARLDPAFGPDATPLHEPLARVLELDAEGFVALARGRPLARAGREGLVRNACVVAGNSGDRALAPALRRRLADPSPIVREHAAWALAALGEEGEDGGPPRAAPAAAAG